MGKFMMGSSSFWLDLHLGDVERFKRNMIDIDSWGDFDNLVEENLNAFKIIIEDYSTRMYYKVEIVINYFKKGKSKTVFITGAKDSGKTCFCFWLAESIHNIDPSQKIAYVGVRLSKEILPDWCECYMPEDEELLDPNNRKLIGYLIIVDELAIQYNAREFSSKKNISFGQLLAISRHKDMYVLAIVQDPSMGDINIWKLRDLVIYKRSNTYELPDRDNRRQSPVMKFWIFIKRWLAPTRQEQALFECQSEKKVMLFIYDLPKCWNEKLSKAFRYFEKHIEEKEVSSTLSEMP